MFGRCWTTRKEGGEEGEVKEGGPVKVEQLGGSSWTWLWKPFILRARPWLPFDQFIQGFKTFLRARPPGFVSFPRFFSILHRNSRILVSFPLSPRCAVTLSNPRHVSAIFCADDGSCRSSYETLRTYPHQALQSSCATSWNADRESILRKFEAVVFYFLLRGRSLRPSARDILLAPLRTTVILW